MTLKEEFLNKLRENELYRRALASARDENEKNRLITASEGVIEAIFKNFSSLEDLKKDPEKLKQIQQQLHSLISK